MPHLLPNEESGLKRLRVVSPQSPFWPGGKDFVWGPWTGGRMSARKFQNFVAEARDIADKWWVNKNLILLAN